LRQTKNTHTTIHKTTYWLINKYHSSFPAACIDSGPQITNVAPMQTHNKNANNRRTSCAKRLAVFLNLNNLKNCGAVQSSSARRSSPIRNFSINRY